jgi:hypothetical protein
LKYDAVLAFILTQSVNCGTLGIANSLSRRSASKRKIRTWFPRWQPQNMYLAGGVHRAGMVFATLLVHFQVVDNPFAPFVITQDGHVFRMMQVEEFHA